MTHRGRVFRQLASVLLICGFLAAADRAASQDTSGVQRNLLERQQQDNEFHVRLYDNVPAPVPGTPGAPTPAQAASESAARAADAAARRQLYDSQLRRQLELQNQTRGQDATSPQTQTQLQQLQQQQFERETEAQRLQQGILRDSSNRMQQLH